MADFDIQALLQNPLFLAGTGALLAEPQDRYKGFLGGLQQGNQLQQAAQLQQLRALQIKAAQAQQDFNPSDYMQTKPVAGQATPTALAAQLGNQMPATLGGPIGGQTQMGNVAPTQVSPEAGTPTGRVDMQGLLQGGMQAGLSPQAIQQIAGILDPETANAQAIALKNAEPYTLGPGQSRMVGSQVVAKNDALPPGSQAAAIQQLTAARDSFPQGSAQWNTYDAALKKASGETEQAQFDQRQRELNDRAAANLDMRRQAMDNQQQQQLQNKTNQFSNQLQKTGIPQAQQQLDYIRQQFDKTGKDGEIPGYGRIDSMIPDFLLSNEGQANRQAVASFANVLLKTRSGAAVTDPEQKRFLTELGSGKYMPVERLKQGLEMMQGLLDAEKRNAAAGVSNDVLDSYMSTPGAIDFSAWRKKGGGSSGGRVSVDDATDADIDAAIARKMGK